MNRKSTPIPEPIAQLQRQLEQFRGTPYGPETGSICAGAGLFARVKARDNELTKCRESWIHSGSC